MTDKEKKKQREREQLRRKKRVSEGESGQLKERECIIVERMECVCMFSLVLSPLLTFFSGYLHLYERATFPIMGLIKYFTVLKPIFTLLPLSRIRRGPAIHTPFISLVHMCINNRGMLNYF